MWKNTETFIIRKNRTRSWFLIGYKGIYVILLLINIVLFSLKKVEKPDELIITADGYFVYFLIFYFFITTLNAFNLIQIIRKRISFAVLITERTISACRMLVVILVGLGAGWLIIYFSPVLYSLWIPYIGIEFTKLPVDSISKYIFGLLIWLLIFLVLLLSELYYFRNFGRLARELNNQQ